ncbi:MAG: LysR family transcriptional regulator [Aquabacterium sp.]|jgi:molybdate transport repressor ModE-like protein|uniref:LysR family transcriptional regulator n=1 Tax=Aquabacterium sp. TaxID=1872578 RepID=UPI003BAF730B
MPAAKALTYRVDPFDLRLFTAVLEHGTITAAARAAHLSLAATSARLKALEDAVGATLLVRAKAGATPTDAGRALARHAHRVLGDLEALHLEMASFGHGLRGTVRVMGNTAAVAEALPPRLGAFLAKHPDLDLHLQDLPSEAVLDGLRRGAADLGIVADHVDPSGLKVRPWLGDQLVALLPHRKGRGMARSKAARTVSFADLLDEEFIGLSPDSGLSRFLHRQASLGGRLPHHRVRVSTLDALARIVADGAGVAVVPLSTARRWQDERVRMLPLSDAWSRRRLLLCTDPGRQASAGCQALVDYLLQSADEGAWA